MEKNIHKFQNEANVVAKPREYKNVAKACLAKIITKKLI